MKLFPQKSKNNVNLSTQFKIASSERLSPSKDQELIVFIMFNLVTQLLSMHTGAPQVQKEEVKAEGEGEKGPENLIAA